MDFDPIPLAQIQFAFTVALRIVFPAFTIGLSAYIATQTFACIMSASRKFLFARHFKRHIYFRFLKNRFKKKTSLFKVLNRAAKSAIQR